MPSTRSLALAFVSTLCLAAPAQPAELVVRVTGITEPFGQIVVSMLAPHLLAA